MSSPSLEMVNAFLRVIQHGDLPDVNQLHRLHPHLSHAPLSLEAFLNSSNKHGDTPLLVAAREGHVALLELLHRGHGMSLEHSNVDGKTALHVAAHNGQGNCVHYLLKEGAKVDSLKRADWWVCQWVWPHHEVYGTTGLH